MLFFFTKYFMFIKNVDILRRSKLIILLKKLFAVLSRLTFEVFELHRLLVSIVILQGSANFGPRAKCGPEVKACGPKAHYQSKTYFLKTTKIKIL